MNEQKLTAAFMDEVFPSRKRNNHFSVREKKNDSRVVCPGDESSHLKSLTRTDPLIFLPGCLLRDELSSKCRRRSSKIYFERCFTVTARANFLKKPLLVFLPCFSFLPGSQSFGGRRLQVNGSPVGFGKIVKSVFSAAAKHLRRCSPAVI